jgi:hypothetical protein
MTPLCPCDDHIDRSARSASTRADRANQELVPAPYCWAISAGSGSIWWLHALHHTMSRTRAAGALPSVIGNPGGDFMTLAF